MDFPKVEIFLRDHWPAGIIVMIICIPIIWGIATFFYTQQIKVMEISYSQQIEVLGDRIKNLEIQVKDLKQYKKRLESIEKQKKERKLSGGGLVGYPPESLADALFSPSNL